MKNVRKERDCRYELIRVVASLYVIGVHTLWIISPDIGVKGFYARIIDTIFVLCNPVFL